MPLFNVMQQLCWPFETARRLLPQLYHCKGSCPLGTWREQRVYSWTARWPSRRSSYGDQSSRQNV